MLLSRARAGYLTFLHFIAVTGTFLFGEVDPRLGKEGFAG